MEASVFVAMALHAWNTQIKRVDQFFDSLTDKELFRQVAPGKNTIIYLMGHLIAVNDNMIALLALGERSHAHLDEFFIKNPDASATTPPDVPATREAWKKSKEELSDYFKQLSAEDWFARHTAMTDDDFAKEPSRNKLSVLLNRTNHVSYHLGQLILSK